MKKLLILIVLLGMFSCSKKICLTDKNSGKSRTFKYQSSVVVDDEYVRFTTKKGTKQSVPKNMYDFEIE